jgi:signal transduction histidine kinase
METGTLGNRRRPEPDAVSTETDRRVAAAVLEGQEQERTRLAEELHDGTAQALANAIFQVEIAMQAVRRDPATAPAALASLGQMLERELDNLRAYISQLRPSLSEQEGLEDTLRESAAQLTARTGIPVDVRFDAPAGALDSAARAVALRVAQEALRNVGKHARASQAWLTTSHTGVVGSKGATWQLEIGDDGRGFDAGEVEASRNRRHFGLRFMRERAELLGAELAIETGPAVGTVVRLSINTGGERSQL